LAKWAEDVFIVEAKLKLKGFDSASPFWSAVGYDILRRSLRNLFRMVMQAPKFED